MKKFSEHYKQIISTTTKEINEANETLLKEINEILKKYDKQIESFNPNIHLPSKFAKASLAAITINSETWYAFRNDFDELVLAEKSYWLSNTGLPDYDQSARSLRKKDFAKKFPTYIPKAFMV